MLQARGTQAFTLQLTPATEGQGRNQRKRGQHPYLVHAPLPSVAPAHPSMHKATPPCLACSSSSCRPPSATLKLPGFLTTLMLAAPVSNHAAAAHSSARTAFMCSRSLQLCSLGTVLPYHLHMGGVLGEGQSAGMPTDIQSVQPDSVQQQRSCLMVTAACQQPT